MARPRPKIPRRRISPRPKHPHVRAHGVPPSSGGNGDGDSNGNNGTLSTEVKDPRLHRSSKYHPDFPELLLKHMEQGLSFETFGATAGLRVSKKTLYNWVHAHPEFAEAKEIGWRISQEWWERLGIALTADDPTYQLKALGIEPFLKKCTTRLIQGGPVMDVIEEYHVPRGNTGAWIFNMKNRFGWKDVNNLEISGAGGGPIELGAAPDLSRYSSDVLRKFRDIKMQQQQLREMMDQEDQENVVDVTPESDSD